MIRRMFLLLLLASLSFAQVKGDYLKFQYSEVNPYSACTYYLACNPELIDYTGTNIATRLSVDSYKEEIGALKTSKWEILTEVPETVLVWEPDLQCKDTMTLNMTPGEDCTDKGRYVEEARTAEVWKLLDPKTLSIKAGQCAEVRFCGTFDMWADHKTGGFQVAIDHIPDFAGYTYQDLAWWNVSFGTYATFTADNGNLIQNGSYLIDNATFFSDLNCSADLSDFRILINNNTLVPLWVENSTAQGGAPRVWFKGRLNTTYDVYCNASTTTASNIETAFLYGWDVDHSGHDWTNSSHVWLKLSGDYIWIDMDGLAAKDPGYFSVSVPPPFEIRYAGHIAINTNFQMIVGNDTNNVNYYNYYWNFGGDYDVATSAGEEKLFGWSATLDRIVAAKTNQTSGSGQNITAYYMNYTHIQSYADRGYGGANPPVLKKIHFDDGSGAGGAVNDWYIHYFFIRQVTENFTEPVFSYGAPTAGNVSVWGTSDINFTTPINESVIDLYILYANATPAAAITNISARLVWNGTEYSDNVSASHSGNNWLFNRTMTLPLVSSPATVNVTWILNLTYASGASANQSIDNESQTVNPAWNVSFGTSGVRQIMGNNLIYYANCTLPPGTQGNCSAIYLYAENTTWRYNQTWGDFLGHDCGARALTKWAANVFYTYYSPNLTTNESIKMYQLQAYPWANITLPDGSSRGVNGSGLAVQTEFYNYFLCPSNPVGAKYCADCTNLTCMALAVNVSLKDEEPPNAAVNGSTRATFEAWYGSANKTFNYSTMNLTSFPYYIWPEWANFSVVSFEQYDASGYATRFRFYMNESVDNDTNAHVLYMLNNSLSTVVTIFIRDTYGTPYPWPYINALRYFPDTNSYLSVAMTQANGDGEATANLRAYDTWYKFAIYDTNGTLIYFSSTPEQATCDPYCHFIITIDYSDLVTYDFYGNVQYSCAYNETTTVITCDYSDTSGDYKWFEMIVRQVGGRFTPLCEEYSNSSTGSLSCNLSASGTVAGKIFKWYFYGHDPPPEFNVLLDWGNVDNYGAETFGSIGTYIAFILVVLAGLAFVVLSPVAGVVAAWIVLVVVYMLQLVNMDIGMVVGLGVAVIIVGFVFGRSRQ